MAEFMYRGEKITGIDEPITLENNTGANFDVSVGIGIIFRKSGLYRVSVGDKHTSVKIEPERKKGKWIEADSQCGIGCPFCGTPVDDFCNSIDYINLSYEPNFCPNCGADMRDSFTIPTEIIESVIGYDD